MRALAFADVDSAKRWAKSLPLTERRPVCETVLGQLRALAAATFPPRERATIAEVLREPVAHLHTELARRYAGKPQPAADRELEAAEQAIALWQGLWEQYSACLKPLLEGDPELAGREGEAPAARPVRRQAARPRARPRAPRRRRRTLWQELHAYYRLAEMLDCAVTAVSDDLLPHAVGISCYSTYSHALLLGARRPLRDVACARSSSPTAGSAQWARKVFPYAQQRETEGPGRSSSTSTAARARRSSPSAPREPPASMRFGYPGKLATSVRGRLKRLAAGATPAELQLGHDRRHRAVHRAALAPRRALVPAAAARPDAAHDDGRAHAPAACRPRTSASAAARSSARIPLGRLTFQGAQHLQTLGALTDYDRYREDAERDWPWERWQGTLRAGAKRRCARESDAATAGSSTSSSSCATTSARAWATSRAWRVATRRGELALSL